METSLAGEDRYMKSKKLMVPWGNSEDDCLRARCRIFAALYAKPGLIKEQ